MKSIFKISTYKISTWRLAFSPNGKLIASTGGDRLVRVWDATTGVCLHELSGYTDYIADLQFADDRTLLTRSYNSPLRQWDLDRRQCQILDCLRDIWILGFTISPDRQWLALGSNSSTLALWHRFTGETIEHPIEKSARSFSIPIDPID